MCTVYFIFNFAGRGAVFLFVWFPFHVYAFGHWYLLHNFVQYCFPTVKDILLMYRSTSYWWHVSYICCVPSCESPYTKMCVYLCSTCHSLKHQPKWTLDICISKRNIIFFGVIIWYYRLRFFLFIYILKTATLECSSKQTLVL